MELVTRYPIPELNEHGHVDMSELAFRDTLDEYFDIFVIILRWEPALVWKDFLLFT